MSAVFGALGFGLFALACLAFFTLLGGALVYIVVFGDPDKKRWRRWAAARGWHCDGPWRLAGGPPDARWSVDCVDDDDRGTGTVTWAQAGIPASAPPLVVIRRADYEREPCRSSFSDLGMRDAGVGGPHFAPYWAVLTVNEPDARAFLTAETETAWLSALAAMPSLHADRDVMLEVRAPHVRLRVEGATRRPPLDEVATFVDLGLTLTAAASLPQAGRHVWSSRT